MMMIFYLIMFSADHYVVPISSKKIDRSVIMLHLFRHSEDAIKDVTG
jgi:hypothetical protein